MSNLSDMFEENDKQLYVDPQHLRDLIRKYKNAKKENPEHIMDDELAGTMLKMAIRFSSKPSFSGYSYRQDFVIMAAEKMIKAIEYVDPDDPRSPFSYLTQTCYRSIIQYIKKEKNYENTKEQVKDYVYTRFASNTGLKQVDNPNLDNNNDDYLDPELKTAVDEIPKYDNSKIKAKPKSKPKTKPKAIPKKLTGKKL